MMIRTIYFRRLFVLFLLLLIFSTGFYASASEQVFFSNGHFLGLSGGSLTAPDTFDGSTCVWTTTATAGNSGTFSMTLDGSTYYLTTALGVTSDAGEAGTFYLDATGRQVSTAESANYLQYNGTAWDAEGTEAADNCYELQGVVTIQWLKNSSYYLAAAGSYYNSNSETPYLATSNGTAQKWALLKHDSDYSYMLHLPTSKFVIAHSTSQDDKAVHLETVSSSLGTSALFKITNSNGIRTIIPNGSTLGFNSWGGAGKTIGLFNASDAGSKWSTIDSEMEPPTIAIDADKNIVITTSIANGTLFYNIVTNANATGPTPNSTTYTGPIAGTTGTYIKAIACDPTTGLCSGITTFAYFTYDTEGYYVIYNNGHFLGIDDSGALSNSITNYEEATCRWSCDENGIFSITKDEVTYYLTCSSSTLSVSTVQPAAGFQVDPSVRLCTTLTDGTYSGYVQYSDGAWNANGEAQDNCYMNNDNNKLILWTSNTAYGLAPSNNNYATGMPYLRTSNATPFDEWVFLKEYDPAYTLLINKSTGQFIVANASTNDAHAVHLESPTTLDHARFMITTNSNGISFISLSDNVSFNSYGGAGNDIGFYSNDNGSRWNILDAAPPTPEISIDLAGNVTITCDNTNASIYYTTDGTDPTSSSTAYTASFSVENGTTVKAIALYNGLYSEIATETFTIQTVATPAISIAENGTVTLSCETEGASIYYTTNGDDPTSSSTLYSAPFEIEENVTVKAIAIKEYMNNSAIATATNTVVTLTSLSQITETGGRYKLGADIDATGFTASIESFSGTLEGNFHTISNLSVPIFETVTDATIRNLTLDEVSIDSGDDNGDAGAIACSSSGSTRIYNCGVLDGSVSGTRYVGGLLGILEDNTRVINCYSFATVTGGDWAAGIVGYNSTATTQDNLETSGMVMNCMFYGEIASGTNIAPVFGGENISNNNSNPSGKALNTFNYFRYMADYCQNGDITTYNCALGAKELHLRRFEFYRYLLNSNRELAAWYATGSVDNACDKMAKWVLDRSVAEYPILKAQGTYPSVINYDPEYTYDLTDQHKILRSSVTAANQGKSLGTLQVSISQGDNPPTGASITTTSTNLNIIDKDTANYNFNYYKVQLPYYNEVGSGNYTYNKVVTGWEITVTGGSTQFTTTSKEYPDYNFADRDCTEKDNYANSGRIFAQGGYFNVPEGVSSIAIQPHWATAVYLSDPYYDRVYKKDYGGADITLMGERPTTITVEGSEQTVYTSMSDALGQLSSSGTVYDQAVVLVGNYHLYAGKNDNPFGNSKPCTLMSIDLNADNEPDYSLIQHHHERKECPPIRFDFLNWIPFGIAQKVFATEAPQMPNIAIFKPKGWFEITTTCITELTEMEYDYVNKTEAPLILLGGHIGQITSHNSDNNYNADKTTYFLLGDNVYFDNFCNGIHSDKNTKTRHCPISVTGGEYETFYLSGLYRPDANYFEDNAECYVNGGLFGEMAGAAHESIHGDVYWRIDHADIESFYGGGINNSHPITGSISVIVNNSQVGLYCGGPKFGDMSESQTVSTSATGTTFGTYFGAGYGGTALNRVITKTDYQSQTYDWTTWANSYTRSYDATNHGISTSYETEFFAWAGGTETTNVGRFYVNYASLSLANTREVNTVLTNCTVNNDFYGGGNLGAVNGNITSTLTGCTVYGNIFGAGYSASVPTVEVYPTTGFVQTPSYNSNVGVYNDPVYPDPVTYTWSSKGSTGSPFTEDSEGNWIYTDVDLSSLGKVTGSISLTVDGDTYVQGLIDSEIKGGVFGGGNTSEVAGNIGVNVETTDSQSIPNVFGGANATNVTGDITLTIEGGSISAGVFGGCNASGTIDGDITLNVLGGEFGTESSPLSKGIFGGGYGATTTTTGDVTLVIGPPDNARHPDIYGDIYGGSALGSVNSDTDDATTLTFYNGVLVGNLYGGGLGDATNAATVNGTVTVNVGGSDQSDSDCQSDLTQVSVYGCNNTNGSPQGNVNVNIYRTGHTSGTNSIDDTGFAIAAVYAGGNQADYVPTATDANTQVHVFNCDNTIEYVYGGGNASAVPEASSTIDGGHIGWIFAGGNGAGESNPGANVGYLTGGTTAYGTGNATATIIGGTIDKSFAGSNTKGTIRSTAKVSFDYDPDGCDLSLTEVFGGGNQADITGDVETVIECNPDMDNILIPALYGGCNMADIDGNVTLTVYGGSYLNVYGGSKGTSDDAADITGNVTLNMYGGRVGNDTNEGNIFGGSNINGSIGGQITVNIEYSESNACLQDYSHANVFGGGNLAAYEGIPIVNINHGTVLNVFGGGNGDPDSTTQEPGQVKGSQVNIGVYSDDSMGHRPVILGNVYGGGNAAKVDGDTQVKLEKRAKIYGNVYGGGDMGEVTGNTKVIVNGNNTNKP